MNDYNAWMDHARAQIEAVRAEFKKMSGKLSRSSNVKHGELAEVCLRCLNGKAHLNHSADPDVLIWECPCGDYRGCVKCKHTHIPFEHSSELCDLVKRPWWQRLWRRFRIRQSPWFRGQTWRSDHNSQVLG